MNAGKILLAGVLNFLFNTVFRWLTCGWLFNWVYQLPPNVWKDPSSMMKAGNMIGSNAVGFIHTLIFVIVYIILYDGIPGKGVKKGMMFGFLVWLAGSLTGIGGMPFYMTISTTVVIYWIIQSLIISVINGIVTSALCKE